MSGTKAAFGLGSYYSGFSLNPGDSYTIGIDGSTFSGTVSYAAPSSATITKVRPAQGPGGGGTAVTIKGTNLTGTRYVFFGTTPAAAVRVVSSTEITASAPAGTGTVSVEPVSSSGQVGSSSADLRLRGADAHRRQPGQGSGPPAAPR